MSTLTTKLHIDSHYTPTRVMMIEKPLLEVLNGQAIPGEAIEGDVNHERRRLSSDSPAPTMLDSKRQTERIIEPSPAHFKTNASPPRGPLQPGDLLPCTRILLRGNKVTLREFFNNKRGVLFGGPGAFTPICSERHIVGFRDQGPRLQTAVDFIGCIYPNDPYVLKAWARSKHIHDELTFISDIDERLMSALGIRRQARTRGLEHRSRRFAMVISKGGVIEWAAYDENCFAEDVLAYLGLEPLAPLVPMLSPEGQERGTSGTLSFNVDARSSDQDQSGNEDETGASTSPQQDGLRHFPWRGNALQASVRKENLVNSGKFAVINEGPGDIGDGTVNLNYTGRPPNYTIVYSGNQLQFEVDEVSEGLGRVRLNGFYYTASQFRFNSPGSHVLDDALGSITNPVKADFAECLLKNDSAELQKLLEQESSENQNFYYRPLELQIVHERCRVHGGDSRSHPLVVSVTFDIPDSDDAIFGHPFLDVVLSTPTLDPETYETFTVGSRALPGQSFPIQSLFSKNSRFIQYNSVLSAFNERVTWLVLKDPLPLSRSQLERMEEFLQGGLNKVTKPQHFYPLALTAKYTPRIRDSSTPYATCKSLFEKIRFLKHYSRIAFLSFLEAFDRRMDLTNKVEGKPLRSVMSLKRKSEETNPESAALSASRSLDVFDKTHDLDDSDSEKEQTNTGTLDSELVVLIFCLEKFLKKYNKELKTVSEIAARLYECCEISGGPGIEMVKEMKRLQRERRLEGRKLKTLTQLIKLSGERLRVVDCVSCDDSSLDGERRSPSEDFTVRSPRQSQTHRSSTARADSSSTNDCARVDVFPKVHNLENNPPAFRRSPTLSENNPTHRMSSSRERQGTMSSASSLGGKLLTAKKRPKSTANMAAVQTHGSSTERAEGSKRLLQSMKSLSKNSTTGKKSRRLKSDAAEPHNSEGDLRPPPSPRLRTKSDFTGLSSNEHRQIMYQSVTNVLSPVLEISSISNGGAIEESNRSTVTLKRENTVKSTGTAHSSHGGGAHPHFAVNNECEGPPVVPNISMGLTAPVAHVDGVRSIDASSCRLSRGSGRDRAHAQKEAARSVSPAESRVPSGNTPGPIEIVVATHKVRKGGEKPGSPTCSSSSTDLERSESSGSIVSDVLQDPEESGSNSNSRRSSSSSGSASSSRSTVTSDDDTASSSSTTQSSSVSTSEESVDQRPRMAAKVAKPCLKSGLKASSALQKPPHRDPPQSLSEKVREIKRTIAQAEHRAALEQRSRDGTLPEQRKKSTDRPSTQQLKRKTLGWVEDPKKVLHDSDMSTEANSADSHDSASSSSSSSKSNESTSVDRSGESSSSSHSSSSPSSSSSAYSSPSSSSSSSSSSSASASSSSSSVEIVIERKQPSKALNCAKPPAPPKSVLTKCAANKRNLLNVPKRPKSAQDELAEWDEERLQLADFMLHQLQRSTSAVSIESADNMTTANTQANLVGTQLTQAELAEAEKAWKAKMQTKKRKVGISFAKVEEESGPEWSEIDRKFNRNIRLSMRRPTGHPSLGNKVTELISRLTNEPSFRLEDSDGTLPKEHLCQANSGSFERQGVTSDRSAAVSRTAGGTKPRGLKSCIKVASPVNTTQPTELKSALKKPKQLAEVAVPKRTNEFKFTSSPPTAKKVVTATATSRAKNAVVKSTTNTLKTSANKDKQLVLLPPAIKNQLCAKCLSRVMVIVTDDAIGIGGSNSSACDGSTSESSSSISIRAKPPSKNGKSRPFAPAGRVPVTSSCVPASKSPAQRPTSSSQDRRKTVSEKTYSSDEDQDDKTSSDTGSSATLASESASSDTLSSEPASSGSGSDSKADSSLEENADTMSDATSESSFVSDDFDEFGDESGSMDGSSSSTTKKLKAVPVKTSLPRSRKNPADVIRKALLELGLSQEPDLRLNHTPMAANATPDTHANPGRKFGWQQTESHTRSRQEVTRRKRLTPSESPTEESVFGSTTTSRASDDTMDDETDQSGSCSDLDNDEDERSSVVSNRTVGSSLVFSQSKSSETTDSSHVSLSLAGSMSRQEQLKVRSIIKTSSPPPILDAKSETTEMNDDAPTTGKKSICGRGLKGQLPLQSHPINLPISPVIRRAMNLKGITQDPPIVHEAKSPAPPIARQMSLSASNVSVPTIRSIGDSTSTTAPNAPDACIVKLPSIVDVQSDKDNLQLTMQTAAQTRLPSGEMMPSCPPEATMPIMSLKSQDVHWEEALLTDGCDRMIFKNLGVPTEGAAQPPGIKSPPIPVAKAPSSFARQRARYVSMKTPGPSALNNVSMLTAELCLL